MKRMIRILIIMLLLVLGLGGYFLFTSFRDAKVKTEKTSLFNIYAASVSGQSISVVTQEGEKNIPMASETESFEAGVVNLKLEDGVVVKVERMPETIQGKVLLVTDHEIEIEGYGKIPIHKNFQAYQLGNLVSNVSKDNIVVGYSSVRFVVAKGKVQGAIIPEKMEADRIRVLIKTSDYSSYEHEKVVLTATKAFQVTDSDGTKTYPEKTAVTLDGTKRTQVVSPGGRVRILSVKRQNRNPKYRGTIEVTGGEKGCHIVNELSLEEYLYSVVPSEMPVNYGSEALKAQAVCARSYGYGQILANKLRQYGAHVDDSVSYQVYNNVSECREAREAVRATRGQIVMQGEKVASTYFFSTSCGVTSGVKDVWYTKKELPYLSIKKQCEGGTAVKLSEENELKKFIDAKENCYDSESPWFRWNAITTKAQIQKSIEAGIAKRCKANPTHIQVKTADGFQAKTIEKIGSISKIKVIKRGESGIAKCVEVTGSEKTIRIYTEYNIRFLLGLGADITRADGVKTTGTTMLPSGFFYLTEEGDKIQFNGGGYGHGVGMSQNGAKKMAEEGKPYDAILTFYYGGTSIGLIY